MSPEGAIRDASSRGLLERLPASLEWAVLFRLPSLIAAAGDELAVRRAFSLAPTFDLGRVSHVVLTSAGSQLGRDGELKPFGGSSPLVSDSGSYAGRFAVPLSEIEVESADCVGLGQLAGGAPVVMAAWVGEDGAGRAEAWFAGAPSREDWELLAAVGVREVAEPRRAGDEPNRIRFSYSLIAHLEAAGLAGFSRASGCTRFFLGQGHIDTSVRAGLKMDLSARISTAARSAYADALALAERELSEGLEPMTAVGPRGRMAYGDLVPLALLLAALRRPPDMRLLERGLTVVDELERRLRSEQRDGGWPFHRGTVTTARDSAFVLLGLRGSEGVDGLERFRAHGGYVADGAGLPTTSAVAAPSATAHPRLPDIATTALVRVLRQRAGLPEATSATWFAERFDSRSSPFIACPWTVDWLLAIALEGDESPDAVRLRARLCDAVLASRNEDWTFGREDERVLATASAALALATLGERGRTLALVQLALAGIASREDTACVPFISTARREPSTQAVRAMLTSGGVIASGDQLYELTRYEDTSGAVRAGLVALALSRPGDPGSTRSAVATKHEVPYRFGSLAEYAAWVLEHTTEAPPPIGAGRSRRTRRAPRRRARRLYRPDWSL